MQAIAAARAGPVWTKRPEEWASGLRDRDPHVRHVATKALGMVNPKKAAPFAEALQEQLDDESAQVRSEAIATIGKLGKAALPLAPDLEAVIQEDRDAEVRAGAARALGTLGAAEVMLHAPGGGGSGAKKGASRPASAGASRAQASPARPASAGSAGSKPAPGAGAKGSTAMSRPASAGSLRPPLPHGKALLGGLMDDDLRVRSASSLAIKRMVRPESAPRSRAKQQASREAIGLYSSSGLDDRLFGRLLAHRLEEEDPKVRSWSASALGVIGKAAAPQGSALEHLLAEVACHRIHDIFEGSVCKESSHCIVSFPGAYLDEWESFNQHFLDGALSTACVFLPRNDPGGRYGQHEPNPEAPEQCYCKSLYGVQKPWGCKWFHLWQAKVKAAVKLGMTLLVVFRNGEVDKGVVEWGDLAKEGPKLWNKVGLGGSQKGEVAWLRKHGLEFASADLLGLKSLLGMKEHPTEKKLREKDRAAPAEVQRAAAQALGRVGLRGPDLAKKKAAPKAKSRGKSRGKSKGKSSGKAKK